MGIINKIYNILTVKQRKVSVVQFFLMLIGMVFETLGIGLIIPALSLMSQENLIDKHPEFTSFFIFLGNPSQKELIVIVMLALLFVYILKSIYLGLLAWKQSKFVFGIQSSFSQKLFSGYLHQPYSFHLQKNSAQLIRNVTVIVSQVTSSLTAFIILLTEFFTFLGIFIFLFYVEPKGTLLLMGIFGFSAWGFHLLTHSRLLKWGQAYQLHEGMRLQHLQQGLGGAKDIKLLGREDDFLNLYLQHNTGSAKLGRRQQTLQALPRLWLELLAITGMTLLVIFMIRKGENPGLIVPTLGLFAAAAFRLIPSVNRIMVSVQSLRYAQPAIESLSEELSLIDQNEPLLKGGGLITFCKAITVENVTYNYPDVEIDALSDISLTIPFGSTVGFVGTSGAGKSTLVDIILGLLQPTKGSVKIDGVDIYSNLRGWQDQIGYVSQTIYLTDDTLRRNIAFGLSDEQIDNEAVLKAIKLSQLDQYVKSLTLGLDTLLGERGVRLSGGQRQRIGIARALYHNPSVLVLDEATSSLDNVTENYVMEAVNFLKGEKTILIVAHRLSTVENCDCLFRLEHGKMIAVETPEGNAVIDLPK